MARYLAGRAKKDRGRTKARTDYTAPDPTARMGSDFAEEEFLLIDLKTAYSCHLLLTSPSIPQVPMEVPYPLLGIFLYYVSCPTSLSVGESSSAPVLLSLGPSNKS